MSNSTALALIIATFASIFFCFSYATKHANECATEIATGVVRGIPVSPLYRWMMLYNHWAGYAAAAVAALVFGAFLHVRIAADVTDGDVKALAHIAAVITGVAAVWWAVSAILEVIQYRSMLRQADAD